MASFHLASKYELAQKKESLIYRQFIDAKLTRIAAQLVSVISDGFLPR